MKCGNLSFEPTAAAGMFARYVKGVESASGDGARGAELAVDVCAIVRYILTPASAELASSEHVVRSKFQGQERSQLGGWSS